MKYQAKDPEDYIRQLPEERKEVFKKLTTIIKNNIPEGFKETISYNMIAYVVPKTIYPKGYQVNPDEPLPFIYLASQKNHIALYHMGIYMDEALSEWFVKAYKEAFNRKPDMGKSCIRFKNINKIPYDLIKDLVKKVSLEEWIRMNEEAQK
ncbi:MAG: DUF1801 domain-containing protein [Candidatus Izemoplasmatales bacterium]